MHSIDLKDRAPYPTPRFSPMRFATTRGAIAAFALAGVPPHTLFARHLRGDWGLLGEDDSKSNERALQNGGRLMSVFELEIPYPDSPRTLKETVWVITEADRSVCTALLPQEY